MQKKILPLFPSHFTYVEPFGGGASLLFAKHPSPVEIYNDLNTGLVNMFRVIRDKKMFKKFHRLVSLTPYAREEFNYCRETWEQCSDPIERAYRFFIVARMSFSGDFGVSIGMAITTNSRRMAKTTSRYLSAINQLPQIHARLMRVQIENQSWETILERYDTPETLFYLDPPYPHCTRSAGKYKHEMTNEDHAALVETLLKIKGQAVLSSYPNEIYKPLAGVGWEYREWETTCYAAGKTKATGILGKGAAMRMQPRTEAVWIKRSGAQRRQYALKF